MAAAEPAGVPTEQLRSALSLFATGVTVASARDPASGSVRGMTANAFMAGSLTPPLVVLGVRQAARLHPWIVAAGAFGVSILSRRLEPAARYFAGLSAPGEPAPAAFVDLAGVPVLAGAVATLATVLRAAHQAGDHTLFIGEVVAIDTGGAAQPVLGYHRSRFARIAPLPDEGVVPVDPWSGSADPPPAAGDRPG